MDDRTEGPKLAWSTPTLRRYELTDEEMDELRKAEDPLRRLLALKPELAKRRSS